MAKGTERVKKEQKRGTRRRKVEIKVKEVKRNGREENR